MLGRDVAKFVERKRFGVGTVEGVNQALLELGDLGKLGMGAEIGIPSQKVGKVAAEIADAPPV